jgi:hypothetical protein
MQACEVCGWDTREGTRVCSSCRAEGHGDRTEVTALLTSVLQNARGAPAVEQAEGDSEPGPATGDDLPVPARPSRGSSHREQIVLREITPGDDGSEQRREVSSVAASLLEAFQQPAGPDDSTDRLQRIEARDRQGDESDPFGHPDDEVARTNTLDDSGPLALPMPSPDDADDAEPTTEITGRFANLPTVPLHPTDPAVDAGADSGTVDPSLADTGDAITAAAAYDDLVAHPTDAPPTGVPYDEVADFTSAPGATGADSTADVDAAAAAADAASIDHATRADDTEDIYRFRGADDTGDFGRVSYAQDATGTDGWPADARDDTSAGWDGTALADPIEAWDASVDAAADTGPRAVPTADEATAPDETAAAGESDVPAAGPADDVNVPVPDPALAADGLVADGTLPKDVDDTIDATAFAATGQAPTVDERHPQDAVRSRTGDTAGAGATGAPSYLPDTVTRASTNHGTAASDADRAREAGAWTSVAQVMLVIVGMLCVFQIVVLIVVYQFLGDAGSAAADPTDVLAAHTKVATVMLPALVGGTFAVTAFAAWRAFSTPTRGMHLLGLPAALWAVLISTSVLAAVVLLGGSSTIAQARQMTLWAIAACALLGMACIAAPRTFTETVVEDDPATRDTRPRV